MIRPLSKTAVLGCDPSTQASWVLGSSPRTTAKEASVGTGLKPRAVAAFEAEPGAGFVGGGGLEGEGLQDAADLLDLLGVRAGELAFAQIDAVLEADPDVAAHDRADRAEAHLVAPGGEDREQVLIAEQPVRG